MSIPDSSRKTSSAKNICISLFCSLLAGGFAFWSGYSMLISPAGWIGQSQMHSARKMRWLGNDLNEYCKQNHKFPETTQEIYGDKTEKESDEPDYRTVDSWETPIIYEHTETTWTLKSLGADGQPGGVGLDCDIICTNDTLDTFDKRLFTDKKFKPTFEQARVEPEFMTNVINCLVFTVLIFGFFFYCIRSSRRINTLGDYFALVILLVFTIYFAFAIAAVHNIASGH